MEPTDRQKKNYVHHSETLELARSLRDRAIEVFKSVKTWKDPALFEHSMYVGLNIGQECDTHSRNDIGETRFANITDIDNVYLDMDTHIIHVRKQAKTKKPMDIQIEDSVWPMVEALIRCRVRLGMAFGIQQDYLFHADRAVNRNEDGHMTNLSFGSAQTRILKKQFPGKNVSLQIQRTAIGVAGGETPQATLKTSKRLGHSADNQLTTYNVQILAKIRDEELACPIAVPPANSQ